MTSERIKTISKVLCINECTFSWGWNLNSPTALAILVNRAKGGSGTRDQISVTSENMSFTQSDIHSSPKGSDPAETHWGNCQCFIYVSEIHRIGAQQNSAGKKTKQRKNIPRGGSLICSQANALPALPAQKLFSTYEKDDLNKYLEHTHNWLTESE